MTTMEFIITLLSALSAILALAVKLWQTLSELINEKRYAKLFEAVSESIISVEELSTLSGEEKKSKAMELIQAAADELGVKNFDSSRISVLIDEIIEITKRVNTEKN